MKIIPFYVSLIILTFGLLISFLLLEDWWLIIVIQDKDYIDSYHFGSESMTSNGGWKYINKEVYAWSGFGIASVCMIGLITAIIAMVKKSLFLKQFSNWLCLAFIILFIFY